MGLMLDPRERAQLAEAASGEKRVRTWRRMRRSSFWPREGDPRRSPRRSGALAQAFMHGPRRGERGDSRGFKKGHALAESVRWRGKPSCFWKNSLRRGTHKAEATARVAGRSLCYKERAGEGRLRGERAHRAPDAKGARLSLEASEIRARQT